MLTNLGLIVIFAAWVYQARHMHKGAMTIQKTFVNLYILGVLLLIVDGFSAGLTTTLSLNLLSLIAALTVWMSVKKGK